jgi:serine/threonine protein phosphatase 1
VIEALSGDGWFGCPASYLRGNHEQMMLQFIDDPERYGPLWFRNGAAETFRSYVEDGASMIAQPPVNYRAVCERLVEAMPARHLEWLRTLPARLEDGGYFFAHAGARPGIPLAIQREEDLLWIREGFSDRDAPFEKVVVHGHTPVDQPYFGRYRINLDTGAYFTNRLSCLVLEGPTRRLLSSQPYLTQPAQGAN